MIPRGWTQQSIHSRVRIDVSGCWLWTKWCDRDGYGRSQSQFAHRVSYELFVGPIAEDLTIDHLCRVRHCVNPKHLEAVTRQENCLRGMRDRTHCRQGHAYTSENTRVRFPGGRICRTCERDKAQRYKDRKAAA